MVQLSGLWHGILPQPLTTTHYTNHRGSEDSSSQWKTECVISCANLKPKLSDMQSFMSHNGVWDNFSTLITRCTQRSGSHICQQSSQFFCNKSLKLQKTNSYDYRNNFKGKNWDVLVFQFSAQLKTQWSVFLKNTGYCFGFTFWVCLVLVYLLKAAEIGRYLLSSSQLTGVKKRCSLGHLTCPGVTSQFCWCHLQPPGVSAQLQLELHYSCPGGWWQGSRAGTEREPLPSAPLSRSLLLASLCRSLQSHRSGCLCRRRREAPRWRWCLWAGGQKTSWLKHGWHHFSKEVTHMLVY